MGEKGTMGRLAWAIVSGIIYAAAGLTWGSYQYARGYERGLGTSTCLLAVGLRAKLSDDLRTHCARIIKAAGVEGI